MPLPTPRFIPAVRSIEEPEVKRLKSLKESNARLTGLSLRSVAKTLSVMLEFIKPQKLT